MSFFTSRPGLRRLIPVGAAAAVLAGGAAIAAFTEAVDKTAATPSPSELLSAVQTARLEGMSGTIVYTADLGLPTIPGLPTEAARPGFGSADLMSLVAGTHTLRVWYSGPDKARIALLGTLGETDVITNGRDLWVWDSRANQAAHRTLPAAPTGEGAPQPTAPGALTPGQLSDLVLGALGRSTEVTVGGPVTVAGRTAHELVAAPRDRATLLASVRIAVDAERNIPLRVQVFGRGQDAPALEAAFTHVSFDRPADSQFTFNPPPGAEVIESDARAADPAPTPKERAGAKEDGGAPPATATVGSGWTTVFVFRLPAEADSDSAELEAFRQFLADLPRAGTGSAAGRVVSSHLFSVLFTDDGRVLFGAVSPDHLVRAAADPASQPTP
jgi:outer membrane lipoprotein-sorting protein